VLENEGAISFLVVEPFLLLLRQFSSISVNSR
jgi:hypothetical protein